MYDYHLSTTQREQFIRLCQAARAAIMSEDTQSASTYFRAAAQIHPYSTTVWLGLAKVAQTLQDKRVALENVLAINPDHLEAQQLLDEL
jgi:uncharacterized protein HemY